MKFNKFLFGAAALSMGVFASCSSDEPVKGPDGGNGNAEGDKYVAVRIQSVGDFGSRAAGDGFEEGIGNENKITAENVRFYFFTKDGRPFVMNNSGVNGTVSNTNMVAPVSLNNEILTDGEKGTIEGVLVLGTAAEGYKGNEPAYVICVANPTSCIPFEKFANKTMSSLLDIPANAPTLTAESTFVMTSSTYYDANNKLTYFTDLTGKIKDSAAAAEGDPADIYLERLAAKVRATGLQEWPVKEKDGENLKDATFNIRVLNAADGTTSVSEGVKLAVELTGWRLRNIAANNFAIKNLLAEWITPATQPFAAWNIADLHRSYWTNPSSQTANDITNVSYDIYNAAQFNLVNFDKATPTANVVYCYENTLQPTNGSVSDRANSATAMVVRGIVKMNGTEVDLCKWGGDYYTEDAFKQVIIENYNQGKNDKDKLTADAVGFELDTRPTAPANTYYAYVTDKLGQPVHNNYRFSNISRWIDGQTSYVVNIKHMGDKFGVVRNHIYDYTFENVVGLGVPGNTPNNPDPEKETYLAARVHVLNWHVVSNNVVLE